MCTYRVVRVETERKVNVNGQLKMHKLMRDVVGGGICSMSCAYAVGMTRSKGHAKTVMASGQQLVIRVVSYRSSLPDTEGCGCRSVWFVRLYHFVSMIDVACGCRYSFEFIKRRWISFFVKLGLITRTTVLYRLAPAERDTRSCVQVCGLPLAHRTCC